MQVRPKYIPTKYSPTKSFKLTPQTYPPYYPDSNSQAHFVDLCASAAGSVSYISSPVGKRPRLPKVRGGLGSGLVSARWGCDFVLGGEILPIDIFYVCANISPKFNIPRVVSRAVEVEAGNHTVRSRRAPPGTLPPRRQSPSQFLH